MRTTILTALVIAQAWVAPAADLAQPPAPDAMALACAARELPAGNAPMTIAGSPDVTTRQLFGVGEPVVVSGGSANGVAVGQDYAVRRPLRGTHLEGIDETLDRVNGAEGAVHQTPLE